MSALKLGCVVALFIAVGAAAPPPTNNRPPKPISSDLPMYPEGARAARVAGTVKMWFVVDALGEVARAQVVSGNPMLRDAALKVVGSWKFRPKSIRPDERHETEFVYVLNVQSKEGEPKLSVVMRDYRRVEVASQMYVETVE